MRVVVCANGACPADGAALERDPSVGIEQRPYFSAAQPGLVQGFPIFLNADGAGSPEFAQLRPNGPSSLVIADGNGFVHAFQPDGKEAPGFPVHTGLAPGVDPGYGMNYLAAAAWKSGLIPPPHDSMFSAAAVGDLRHDGGLEIVTGTVNGYSYAWDGAGRLLPGFPLLDGQPGYFTAPVPGSRRVVR